MYKDMSMSGAEIALYTFYMNIESYLREHKRSEGMPSVVEIDMAEDSEWHKVFERALAEDSPAGELMIEIAIHLIASRGDDGYATFPIDDTPKSIWSQLTASQKTITPAYTALTPDQ